MRFCRIDITLQIIISYINSSKSKKPTHTHILCAGMCAHSEILHYQLRDNENNNPRSGWMDEFKTLQLTAGILLTTKLFCNVIPFSSLDTSKQQGITYQQSVIFTQP